MRKAQPMTTTVPDGARKPADRKTKAAKAVTVTLSDVEVSVAPESLNDADLLYLSALDEFDAEDARLAAQVVMRMIPARAYRQILANRRTANGGTLGSEGAVQVLADLLTAVGEQAGAAGNS